MAFRARKKTSNGHDLGFVGEISSVDPRWIETIWQQGCVPVLSSVALGCDGQYYNVNADQMAVACAAGFEADQLVFLTDVDGVLDGSKRLCAELTSADCERLIAEGVATGGMQAKLNAATSALRQGVGQVRIAPGAAPDVLARVLAGETLGTRLI
jgi:acetylglutamate kinase